MGANHRCLSGMIAPVVEQALKGKAKLAAEESEPVF